VWLYSNFRDEAMRGSKYEGLSSNFVILAKEFEYRWKKMKRKRGVGRLFAYLLKLLFFVAPMLMAIYLFNLLTKKNRPFSKKGVSKFIPGISQKVFSGNTESNRKIVEMTEMKIEHHETSRNRKLKKHCRREDESYCQKLCSRD